MSTKKPEQYAVKFVGDTTRSVLTLSDLSEETSPICISRKQSMMGNHRLDLRTSKDIGLSLAMINIRHASSSKREVPLTREGSYGRH